MCALRAGQSLSAVAAAQAFADQGHFTRQFKRLVGMTPRAYAVVARLATDGARTHFINAFEQRPA
jgi:AraC-like DNA-binding protein